MKLDKFKLTLIILIALGFIYRIWFLSTQSIWMDESFTINAALETLEKGYPLLDSGVFFGTLTLILSFYFGKEFFDKKTALIFTFLMTFSYWEILWSRQARMYIQLQFFYFLSLFLFHKFIKNQNKKNLFLLIL